MQPRVLCVDDEADLLDGLRNTLRKQPYRVVTANSATKAFSILETLAIDVIISDERMPEMPGHAFLAKVCQNYPDTVRMMLTGHASIEAAMAAINEGEIYRFLTKPCPPETLREAVRDALELKAALRVGDKGAGGQRGRLAALRALEADHPGITHVERSSGGVIYLPGAEDEAG